MSFTLSSDDHRSLSLRTWAAPRLYLTVEPKPMMGKGDRVLCDLYGANRQNWEILGGRNWLVWGLYLQKMGLRIREESQITPKFLDWENGRKVAPSTEPGNTRKDANLKRKISQVLGMLNVKCLWNIKSLCPVSSCIHLDFRKEGLTGH